MLIYRVIDTHFSNEIAFPLWNMNEQLYAYTIAKGNLSPSLSIKGG